MPHKSRPWSAYGLRLLCCALLFGSAYVLFASSTFALRMRGDAPVELIVVGLAATLSFLPILAGRRYLGAFLVCGFVISGIGAYWWTAIPWDELFKDSGFPARAKPGILDYALIATPTILAGFYAAISRPSLLRADLKNRGADPDEIRRATSVSFLSGATLLVFCSALAVALWWLMASGIAFAALAPVPTGVPALILVGTLAVVAWALLGNRLPRFRPRPAPRAPTAAAPGAAASRASRPWRSAVARWRARRTGT